MGKEIVTHRRAIIAIACLSMASFGMVLTSIGASLHTVIARFAIDKAQAGALLSLLSFWILAGSLVFGPIVDRRGYKGMLLFAFGAIVVGLEMVAFAPSLVWLRAGVVVIGFSGGLVNGATVALVADVSTEQRGAALTFVSAFFGVGAVGVPFALSSLAGTFPLAAILGAIPVFVLVPLVLTAITVFPPEKQPHGFPVADARRLLRDPGLLLMGLILFVESGMESTANGWTSTLFAEGLKVSAGRAPMYLALFWLGLMLTRLALGFVLRTIPSVRVLFVSVGVALVSSSILVSAHDVAVASVAVFCLGAGFAAVFPLIYGFVGDRYAQLSGTALSLVIAMGMVGGMLLPYITGVFADAHGMRIAFRVVPISLVLLGVLLGVLARWLLPVADPATSGPQHPANHIVDRDGIPDARS